MQGSAIYVVTVTAAEQIPVILITVEQTGLSSGSDAPTGAVYEYYEVLPYRTTDATLPVRP